jgi:predicted transcriptional regulator
MTMILELNDETAELLKELAELEHINPIQLANRLIMEQLEDYLDAKAADKALAELESGEDTLVSFEEWGRQLDAMAD